jgi:hypothetical protein
LSPPSPRRKQQLILLLVVLTWKETFDTSGTTQWHTENVNVPVLQGRIQKCQKVYEWAEMVPWISAHDASQCNTFWRRRAVPHQSFRIDPSPSPDKQLRLFLHSQSLFVTVAYMQVTVKPAGALTRCRGCRPLLDSDNVAMFRNDFAMFYTKCESHNQKWHKRESCH